MGYFYGLKLYNEESMTRHLFSMAICLFAFFTVRAATVDTARFYSNALAKEVRLVTVIPDSATPESRCPVVYLLHGYGGNAASWIDLKPELSEIADRYRIIFACPQGDKSWYLDMPEKPGFRYETYITQDVKAYIDAHYPTLNDRKARAITGMSMGGHGAMYLALRHPDVFGAAGSMSGGLDIRPFPFNWDLPGILGSGADNRPVWERHTAINQIERIKNKELALIIDCGTDDFFFEVNNDFHRKLLNHSIQHDYIVRPGGHTGAYWRNAVEYQILYFLNYFSQE